jgi:hypothetical protein
MAKRFVGALVALFAAIGIAGCGTVELRNPIVVHTPRASAPVAVPATSAGKVERPDAATELARAPSAQADDHFGLIMGEQIPYDKDGAYLHMEFRSIIDGPEVEDAKREYLAQHPKYKELSYMWYVSKLGRTNQKGIRIWKRTIRVNIRIEGFRSGVVRPDREYPVGNQDRFFTKVVKADQVGPNWVQFNNFPIEDGITNLVVPNEFRRPTRMIIEPVGWRGTGAFFRGGVYDMDFDFRLNNSGFIPEIRILADSLPARSR